MKKTPMSDEQFVSLIQGLSNYELSNEQKQQLAEMVYVGGLKAEVVAHTEKLRKNLLARGEQIGREKQKQEDRNHNVNFVEPFLASTMLFTGHTTYLSTAILLERTVLKKHLNEREFSKVIMGSVQNMINRARPLKLDQFEPFQEYVRTWGEIAQEVGKIETVPPLNNDDHKKFTEAEDRKIKNAVAVIEDRLANIAGDFFEQIRKVARPQRGMTGNPVVNRLTQRFEAFTEGVTQETAYNERLLPFYTGRKLSPVEQEEADYLKGWTFEAAKKQLNRYQKEQKKLTERHD